LENHGQAIAGMRAATNEVTPVELLEPVLRAEVEHLAKVMGEVESGAPLHGYSVLPLDRRHSPFEPDPLFDIFQPKHGQLPQRTCR
jgi:hypothetical protein